MPDQKAQTWSFLVFIHLLTISAFFIGLSTALAKPLQVKWSEGEHLELGLEGTAIACKSLGLSAEDCPDQSILRADKAISFRYGEVVTSVDYYTSVDEFMNDRKMDIGKTIKCAYKQKASHPEQRKHQADYPSCYPPGIFSVPGYLEAISTNYTHFGWNSMVAYVDLHTQALQMAKRGFNLRSTNMIEAKQLMNKALIYNAFADHYLTDAFASGHIRVPRVQIKEWAKNNLSGVLAASRGDLLTMFLHNAESRNLRTKKEEGLKVTNARGDFWITRGDGNMNLLATDQDLAIIMPRTALVESFKDILIAWEYGDLPVGIYQASLYVPYQNDMPLVEKLSPGYQKVKRQEDVTKLLFSSLSVFEKLLFNKSDFNTMMDELSGLFIKFRRDVAKEQGENSELKKRLPEKYLQAFLEVE
jgi:hypothetical protein